MTLIPRAIRIMNETPTPPPASSLPVAVPVRRRRLPFAWLLPLIGLAAVGYFAYGAYTQNQPNLTLKLSNAAGIKAFQTPVRCRGVEVGTVTHVELGPDGRGAKVSIRLDASGLHLATPDSEWWVIRPEFSLTDISGVESLLSGPSIEYRPGSETPRRQKTFTALPGPPPDAGMTGGLCVFLTANTREAIEPGTPVRFRGVPIGRIISMRLPTHGQSVVFVVEIDLPFTHLVCEDSVFWYRKHAHAHIKGSPLGLDGYDVQLPRVNQALDVSIEVATPESEHFTPIGPRSVFEMQFDPPEDYETWAPDLTPEKDAPLLDEPAALNPPGSTPPAELDQPKDEVEKSDPLGDIFKFINPFD